MHANMFTPLDRAARADPSPRGAGRRASVSFLAGQGIGKDTAEGILHTLSTQVCDRATSLTTRPFVAKRAGGCGF